jgi:hypothetical protein
LPNLLFQPLISQWCQTRQKMATTYHFLIVRASMANNSKKDI